jgi:hypothetical protein
MKSKVFEIGKWIVIGILGVIIFLMLKTNKELNSSFEAYKKDGTYITMYQNQTIAQLKKTNRELYDSIKNIPDVTNAMIIKYKYVYNGDTIYIDRTLPPAPDSVYVFSKKSDTISYTAKVKTASKPQWCVVDFTINDKLTLINREVNGQNQLTITTNGGTITGTQVFNKDDKRNDFWHRISTGFHVGGGVGYTLTPMGLQPGVYVGVGYGINYRTNKIK